MHVSLANRSSSTLNETSKQKEEEWQEKGEMEG